MSLLRDTYWVDPATLDAKRADLRKRVLKRMLREVAYGADGRTVAALLRHPADEAAQRAVDDTCVAELPGAWHVLSEQWQGPERLHFFAKALYVDRESGSGCFVSGDLSTGSTRSDDDIPCEAIWAPLEVLRIIAGLV